MSLLASYDLTLMKTGEGDDGVHLVNKQCPHSTSVTTQKSVDKSCKDMCIFDHFPSTHSLVRTHCSLWQQKPSPQ